jgi:nucleoside-triphosphatase
MTKKNNLSEKQIRNLFLTGPPSSGKTTVIKKVQAKLDRKATGFHTEEIKKHNKRVGFLMKTLDNKEGLLGHEDIKSRFHIRRYGISIENVETLAIPSIIPKSEDEIIIIDEIGKMECFSEKFCDAATKALNAPNVVLGTIAVGGTDFIRKVKERKDIKIYEVTAQNRNELPKQLIEAIEKLLETTDA